MVCLVGFTWTVSADQATRAEQARHYATGYAQSAQDRIARTCNGAEPASLTQCIREQIKAAREGQRAEYDLSAQESMADWAKIMAALTLATFVATTVGVWLVKLTLDATLEAVQDAGRGTEAMMEANKIAALASENQIRPWLSVRIVNGVNLMTQNGLPRIYYTLEIENIGSSPAVGITYSSSLCIGYEPHIDMSANYRAREKAILGYQADLMHGAKMMRSVQIEHTGSPVELAEAYLTVTAFYQTTLSQIDRVTAVFYTIRDGDRDDRMIDFGYPLSSTKMIVEPWSELPGIIE